MNFIVKQKFNTFQLFCLLWFRSLGDFLHKRLYTPRLQLAINDWKFLKLFFSRIIEIRIMPSTEFNFKCDNWIIFNSNYIQDLCCRLHFRCFCSDQVYSCRLWNYIKEGCGLSRSNPADYPHYIKEGCGLSRSTPADYPHYIKEGCGLSRSIPADYPHYHESLLYWGSSWAPPLQNFYQQKIIEHYFHLHHCYEIYKYIYSWYDKCSLISFNHLT